PDARAIYRRLFAYARPHWKMFAIGGFGAAHFSGTNAGMFWFISNFLNDTFSSKNPDMLLFVPVAIVVLFIVRSCGDYIASYFPGHVGRQVVKELRGELFAKYMHLPAGFYDRTSAAQMLSKLTYNIELLADAATTSLVNLIRDSL